MDADRQPYYRPDLALVHHLAFGHHADACAADVLALLEPVRGGSVLELGCGSGRLTRHLVRAGHRVIATDASPAMLDLARAEAAGAEEIRRLTLPGDQLPRADAVVSVGHALNYLADEAAIERALAAVAEALEPGGVLALDLCDLRWGEVRRDQPNLGRVGEDWAIVTAFSQPEPARYVREMTTFVRDGGGWRRDDERHDNVLVDTAGVPALLARHGVEATIAPSFGDHPLPGGLVAVVGRRALDERAPAGGHGGVVVVEDMTPQDWPAVRAVYEDGIATGAATFETRAPGWAGWDATHLAQPRLTARRDGALVGWAALSPVSERGVYAGVAEVSVYVAAAARGRGIGRLLLSELGIRAERSGIWTLQAGVFPENTASLALHRACGFRSVGTRERLGRLHGRWRDVVLLERRSRA